MAQYASLGLAVAAIFYVAGIAIMNIYLSSNWGIYEFGLLRSRYIAVGAAFFFLTALPFIFGLALPSFLLPPSYVQGLAWRALVIHQLKRAGSAVLVTGAAVFLWSAWYAWVVATAQPGPGGEVTAAFGGVYAQLILLPLAAGILLGIAIAARSRVPTLVFGVFVLIAIGITPIWLTFYARFLFPLVPAAAGGGQPVPVGVFLTPETAIDLLPESSANTSASFFLYLIDTTDDGYLFAREERPPVRSTFSVFVPKSRVIAIQSTISRQQFGIPFDYPSAPGSGAPRMSPPASATPTH